MLERQKNRLIVVCNCCRKPVEFGKPFWSRKSKGKVLHFCSLECNIKLLEGNVRDAEQDKLLQAAKDQLEESKWPENEKAHRRGLREAIRNGAQKAIKATDLEFKK